jgi:ATP-dependent Clp protease adaptor protein ClpS
MADPKKSDAGKSGTLLLPKPADPKTRKAPLFHVILHDDDTHTYQYVIEMLMQLFGKTAERAFQHADEVNNTGVSIVETTTLERAELKRDQIRAFGPDKYSNNSKGSMSATIEPAE